MKDRGLDKDTRYVYGARCFWHDSIHKAGNTGPTKMKINGREIESHGLPCCPFCGSMLYESRTKEDFFKGAKECDEKHPGYLEVLIWSQGKCFANMVSVIEAYNKNQNKRLKYSEMFKK